MIAFTDVQYADHEAVAACLLADRWDAAAPRDAWTAHVSPIADYTPGAFYKRELPCLEAVLARAPRLACIVVDGYVWLDALGTEGLGAHLYRAMGAKVPVIGLAKTAYRGSPMAALVSRPGTSKSLYVTSIGMEQAEAVASIQKLHGAHRIPALVREVDRLARAGLVALRTQPST